MAQRNSGNGMIIGMFVLAGVLNVGLLIAGQTTGDFSLLAAGVLGLVVLAVGAAIIAAVRQVAPAATTAPSLPAMHVNLDPVLSHLDHLEHNMLLSDDVRRVLFHERDLQSIRNAVDTELAHGNDAAAEAICNRVDAMLKMPDFAAELRHRIEQTRQVQSSTAFNEAMVPLTQRLAARDWAGAHTEAGKLKQIFPQAAAQIDQHILQAREQHKQTLRAAFHDAAAAHDVDRAMQLLHDLDKFLSPQEAAALSQTAQQVIAEHRETLGRQFKKAVSEKRWSDAARQGDLIVHSYPNSKMAAEVRGMIDMVRTRATEAAVSAADAAQS